jgi:hypothetical protein
MSKFTIRDLLWLMVVVAIAVTPRSAAIGEEAEVEVERYIKVPGGGTLSYSLEDGKDGPQVVSLLYSGPPEWVVNQQDPRSHWHKIPTLKEVDLHMATTVSPEEMAYIASLKQVSALSVSETVFRGRALAPLERMTWLKSLHLDLGSHLYLLEFKADHPEYPRGDFFKFLDKLSALEALSLWPECDEQTYVRICGLKNLKWLTLGEFGTISDKNAAMIANLSRLEQVHLPSLEDPTPFLKGLGYHRHLRDLSFGASTLDTSDVELMASMNKLETLRLRGKQIGSLSPMSALNRLTTLHLHFDEVDAADGCRFLANLPNLEEVVLSGIGTGDFALAHLRGHKNLQGLGINTPLGDDDIAILESMPKLKILGISNPVGSEWLEAARRRLSGVTIKAVAR